MVDPKSTSPLAGLAEVAYLSFKMAELEAGGVKDIENAKIVEFGDLAQTERDAWTSVAAGVLGTNKMLIVVTPVPIIAGAAKTAHDRAVMTNLTLPGSIVGPEWDAAVLAAFGTAHVLVPMEIEKVKLTDSGLVRLADSSPWQPDRFKIGDVMVVAMIPVEQDGEQDPH